MTTQRLVERIERGMFKFSHAHDAYSVGMRDGMGDAADAITEELQHIVQDIEREAKSTDDPSVSLGMRKAIKILTGEVHR